jgi:hypothetical protein
MMFVTNNRVVGGEQRRRIARMDCLYTLAARKHGEWMNCTANLSALERHELGFRMFSSDCLGLLPTLLRGCDDSKSRRMARARLLIASEPISIKLFSSGPKVRFRRRGRCRSDCGKTKMDQQAGAGFVDALLM